MNVYPLEMGPMQTRVLEAGTGPETLFFIHGLGARADRWRANLPALAEQGFRCIAVDLPGHGFATKSGDFDFTVPNCADLMLGLLDTFDIERAALIGTSLGGYIAATMACGAPERVSHLMLVGTLGIVPMGQEARDRLSSRFGTVTRDGIEGKLRTVLHHDDRHFSEAWLDEEWRINNSPGAHEAFARIADYIKSGIDNDVVGDRLASLSAAPPTAIVWGTEDKAVPPSVGEASRDVLKPALYELIPETGHCPYFEEPEKFNRMVTGFVS
ncbi:MAG: alpha/beta fold hydrolase [Rhodospirillaceae bacterium]|jgi:2-hydroxy-6-oxonona-2,4-dienedioate hydrolase|nr:alpha/beta fold hydrolase [Rhodospirillaceae bacterium]MBT5455113.1 alpha/beta fold hydrolase [Rhodospirillaceae bacterium]